MDRALLDNIITQVLDYVPKTSDILLTVGKPVQVENEGEFIDGPLDPALGKLSPWQMEVIASCILGQKQRFYRELVETGACDLSYVVGNRARFRVNVFSQRGSLAVAMRRLYMKAPGIGEMDLPEIFHSMVRERFGLILITGATGSGKSTSLAALLNSINQTKRQHVVTLEDPVEFVHDHKACTINQRELGVDFTSFASGLRSALRQAPNVILVGEIRDRETLDIALEAAETGHLVMGSLHTGTAGQTINRMVGMVEQNEERTIRGRLSEILKYVVSQRLMPDREGEKVAAFDILYNNIRVNELILNGEDEEKTFYHIQETSSSYGMTTFDINLAELFEKGIIDEETAMLNASDKAKLNQMLDRIKAEQGQEVSDIDGLELDSDYEEKWQSL
ncbi:MAG: PilT/PilU family type 4a pilus ATPase [Desulfohalobiaceae bacterium]|nr:PilT/PilU family type 4a pilus ATPase [Desulfohalobiaceae bacterium]